MVFRKVSICYMLCNILIVIIPFDCRNTSSFHSYPSYSASNVSFGKPTEDQSQFIKNLPDLQPGFSSFGGLTTSSLHGQPVGGEADGDQVRATDSHTGKSRPSDGYDDGGGKRPRGPSQRPGKGGGGSEASNYVKAAFGRGGAHGSRSRHGHADSTSSFADRGTKAHKIRSEDLNLETAHSADVPVAVAVAIPVSGSDAEAVGELEGDGEGDEDNSRRGRGGRGFGRGRGSGRSRGWGWGRGGPRGDEERAQGPPYLPGQGRGRSGGRESRGPPYDKAGEDRDRDRDRDGGAGGGRRGGRGFRRGGPPPSEGIHSQSQSQGQGHSSNARGDSV